mgnify:CR=1 FL=1
MTLNSTFAVVAVGMAGGVLAELLHWWNLRQHAVLPDYARRPLYWVITSAMVLSGGLVSYLYFGSNADGILALHIGAATPILLQKLVTSLPESGGAKGMRGGTSVRRFFQW